MPVIGCPHCATKLKVPDTAVGKKVACPRCNHVCAVPTPNLADLVAVQPAPPPAAILVPAAAPEATGKPRGDETFQNRSIPANQRRSSRPIILVALGIVGVLGFGAACTVAGALLVPAISRSEASEPVSSAGSEKTLAPVQAKPPPPPPGPDEVAKFFAGEPVLKLSIELGPKELEAIRREPRKYVPVTLKEGTKIVGKDVGLHLKGAAGSFRGIDDKPGITLNMNKFGVDQRFHGLDKFHLANSVQDPSYLSELICGEIFRAHGIPASKVCHAVVTIDGRPRGLYYLKEGYDKHFLKESFGDQHGNLYDGGFLRDIDQPLQRLGGDEKEKDQPDLKALLAASREADPAKRMQKLDKVLDLDKFITYLALETILWDWDGYPMNRNNYRIYHNPKTDKLVFFPSGMDQMLGDPNGPLFPNFQGSVARAVLDTPQGRARYLERTSQILKKSFNPDALGKRLTELEAKVRPALTAVDANAGRDFPGQVNRLREAIRQRAKSLEEQLRRTPK